MAVTTTSLNCTKFGLVDEASSSTHYSISSGTWYSYTQAYGSASAKRFYFGFNALSSSLKHNKLYEAQLFVPVNLGSESGTYGITYVHYCEDFDASTITYDTAPDDIEMFSTGGMTDWVYTSDNPPVDISFPSDVNTANTAYQALAAQILGSRAFYLTCKQGTSIMKSMYTKTTLVAGTAPYVLVHYDNSVKQTSQITYQSGPASGYFNPSNAATFQWSFEPADSSIYCADDTFEQASATFYWKSSSDANYTSVSISGTTTSTTIAANTFPSAETISWYVEGTDEDGTTSTSSVYTFSTTAGTVTTTPADPVNQVIDGSASYDFSWTVTSEDGQAASRCVLQYSTDSGTTWTNIVDEASQITSYTVSGGTFPAGSIDWRVLAYNVDGTLGTYTSATFISVAAPAAAQGLSATAVPYSTITWQSSEQQAYQISVDGEVVIKAFGADVYSYTLTDPLSDGNHTISVIVQGQYGFWSQASTVTVTIANSAGDAVTLDVGFGLDADLVWTTSAATQDFYIYRDGVNIGHTENLQFTDRYVLGDHSYYVLNKLTDGNYTQSNTVTGTLEADGAFIALLSGGNWLDITVSENSATEQSYKYSRTYSLRHVSGSAYPVLELSNFEDFSGTYDFACNNYTTAKAIEAFRGHEVIVKSRGDNVLFGAMVMLTSHYGDFVNGYNFSIQKMHVEDYVDDTDA